MNEMSVSDVAKELATLRAELDKLKSREEIRQQIVRYGRGQEWLDETLLQEVFYDDAYVDFGFFRGTFKDYLPMLMEIERGPDTTFHLTSCAQIELEGDTAYVESYGIAGGRTGKHVGIFGGRYIDVWERRDKHWKIARRQYVLDWNMDADIEGELGGSHPELEPVSPRSPEHKLFRRMGQDVTG